MRVGLIFAIFLLAIGTIVGRAFAADADDVRAEFERAYAAATTNANEPSADSERLRNYILYPYLQEARIRFGLLGDAPDFARLDREATAFLGAHDKEVVSADLRRVWYASLAKRQEWERLLANYREVNDPTLRCQMFAARVALERFDDLEAPVIAAWSNAPESRPACEPAFTWLKSTGALTDALIEKRARLALSAGNPAFARQMTALLSKEFAEPLNNWAALIERPRAAIDAAIANPSTPIEVAALIDGWTRLARGDADAAIARFDKFVRARKLSEEAASRCAVELALALSWNRSAEALAWFARVRANDVDDRVAEWHARAALWAGNWKRAATVIDAMSPTLRQQTKWQYWAARVAELRGNRAEARRRYAELLSDDNYYAALAAARLKKSYTPKPRALDMDEDNLRSLAAIGTFARARELLAMQSSELRNHAYDEWRKGYAGLDSGLRPGAIALAARWGWYDQMILTAAQQSTFDDYELLYPRPFDDQVRGAAEIVKLPEALIYATLRQESLYRVDAQSAAGAKGLMQLVPDTAKRTARRWPAVAKVVGNPIDLFDPTANIYVGAAKLREAIDRFDGRIPVALAAYNAGPRAAERWLPRKKMDIDIWIENIPYNETRVYVQRILWHSVVFGWVATHKAQSTVDWLIDVAPNARGP